MDPMEYMLQNNHHRSSGQYDPVHSPSNHWTPHSQSQNNPPYPWSTQNPSLPQLYSHHYGIPPGANSMPDPYSHHASMLPPLLGLSSSSAFSGSMPGPIPPRPNGRTQSYRNGMPAPISPIPSSAGSHNHTHDGAFANQLPAARPPEFQPPMFNLGMPPLGQAQENHSLHRSAYMHADQGAMSHANNYLPHFVPAPLPQQPYIPSSRRGHYSAASITPITPRTFSNMPSPTRPSPPSSALRRSHPRQRRSTSRMMTTEIGREDDEDEGYQGSSEHALYSPGSSESSPEMEDAFVRQMQLVRGAVSTKMVASKLTVRSLQIVKLEELSEADRSCVICYNEYGIETPEGINEVPLRLPKCGHIFGDHCIKKWFEDSDSCPYCRDKLHAEPKAQSGSRTRAFMDLIRSQGVHITTATAAGLPSDEALAQVIIDRYRPSNRQNSSPTRHSVPGGRRSPPREENEHHRRLRPRHRINAVDSMRLPQARNRSVSFETVSQTAGASPGLPSMQEQAVQTSAERQTQDWRGNHTQVANEPAPIVPERSRETHSNGGASLRLPAMSMIPAEAGGNQHPRTLQNLFQVQTGAPFEERMRSPDSAPDLTRRENRLS